MTDPITTPATPLVTPPITTPAPAAQSTLGAPPTGQVAPPAFDTFISALNEENRTFVTTKGLQTQDAVVDSLKSLEVQQGKSVLIPGAEATPEDLTKFYEKLRPATPDAYAFKMPEQLPENFQYSEELAKNAKTEFHKLGLLPAQAQGVHDFYVNLMADGSKSASEQATAAATAAQQKKEAEHTAIVAKWGDVNGTVYKTNIEHATRALDSLGLMDSIKAAGLLSPEGHVMDAKVAFAFAQLGERFYTEDLVGHGDPLRAGVNPWLKETWNETQQGQAFKADPEKSRQLIVAAGLNPAQYGL